MTLTNAQIFGRYPLVPRVNYMTVNEIDLGALGDYFILVDHAQIKPGERELIDASGALYRHGADYDIAKICAGISLGEGGFLLAVKDDCPCGFITFDHHFFDLDNKVYATLYFNYLYVVPHCRGTGISKDLVLLALSDIEPELTQRTPETLTIDYDIDNPIADIAVQRMVDLYRGNFPDHLNIVFDTGF